MKKRSLIFGIAVLIGAALILSGCEQETSTETVTVNKGVAADLTALKELLATSGVNEVTFYGELDVNTETLVIPAGKTVTVKDGGVTLSTGVLGVVGGLTLPPGKEIVVTGAGTVAGGDAVLDSVAGSSAVKAKLYNSLAEATVAFGTGTDSVSAAVVNVSSGDLTAAAVRTGATLYVLGGLTITDAPAVAGKVNALGSLVFNGNADISGLDATKYDYSKATLVTSAAATVTLPATPTIAAIDATVGGFTIGGTSTTGITVTKITGNLALPSSVVAAAITGGPGSVTLAAADSGATFATAATFGNTGTTTLSGAFTFSEGVSFGGDVVLTATKALTLASSKTLSLASDKSVKVGDDIILTADGATVLTAGGATTLTPAAATADTDAKLTLGGDVLTLTSGALAVAEDAELVLGKKLTVAAGAELAVAGTVTAGTDGLVLTGAADAGGAKLSGAGTIVAAKTEITGVWQAVGASGTVTIAATDANASTITASAATVVLTAGAGGTITQGAGASNNLTIAANTTIDLKGTIATPTVVGAIKLSESGTADQGGKLTFPAATSVIKVGSETDGTALTTAAGDFVTAAATTKITVSDIANVSILPGQTTTTKVNTIKGGTASGTLQAFGGSGGTGTVDIKAGTAAGA